MNCVKPGLDRIHPYTSKIKEETKDEAGLTLLQLQRSSAVISEKPRHKSNTASLSSSSSDNLQNNRLSWVLNYDRRIVEVIYWKNKTHSLLILLWLLVILVALRSNTFVYVATGIMLSLITVMLLFVGCSILFQAITRSTATHPFYSTLSRDIVLSDVTQQLISELLLSLLNNSLDLIARVVLVQSFGLTFRAATLLWILWAHVEDVYLLLICCVLVLFTLPKFYDRHSGWCEKLIEVYSENTLTGVITSSFVVGPETDSGSGNHQQADVVLQSKNVLTASITGVVIILTVKFCVADANGDIPNLFSFIWSFYNEWQLQES